MGYIDYIRKHPEKSFEYKYIVCELENAQEMLVKRQQALDDAMKGEIPEPGLLDNLAFAEHLSFNSFYPMPEPETKEIADARSRVEAAQKEQRKLESKERRVQGAIQSAEFYLENILEQIAEYTQLIEGFDIEAKLIDWRKTKPKTDYIYALALRDYLAALNKLTVTEFDRLPFHSNSDDGIDSEMVISECSYFFALRKSPHLSLQFDPHMEWWYAKLGAGGTHFTRGAPYHGEAVIIAWLCWLDANWDKLIAEVEINDT